MSVGQYLFSLACLRIFNFIDILKESAFGFIDFLSFFLDFYITYLFY